MTLHYVVDGYKRFRGTGRHHLQVQSQQGENTARLYGQVARKVARERREDDPHSGRPISSTNDQNVEVVRAVMAKDRRLSVRMIEEETGSNKNAVHRILTEHLHMRKICENLVPKNLSVEQKANRLEICQDLLGRLETEANFFA